MPGPRRFYGLLPKTQDRRDYLFAPAPRAYSGQFVDLSEGIVQIYDQGALGSCVSNGTASAVDFARKKQGLAPIGPSRLFVYYQGRKRAGYPINQDTGLQIRDGFTVISKDGAPAETDWPYQIDRFTDRPPDRAYADGLHDLAARYGAVQRVDIDATIASGYVVVQGFDVYDSFESGEVAQTGIVPMPASSEELLGGHCTVIVSTPVDGADLSQHGAEVNGIPGVLYRKHLNSWGPDWGQGGYYWAPVAFTDKFADDFWMVTTMTDPGGPQPPTPVDADATFARALRPWVRTKHTGIAGNNRVAAAAKVWLKDKGLG